MIQKLEKREDKSDERLQDLEDVRIIFYFYNNNLECKLNVHYNRK